MGRVPCGRRDGCPGRLLCTKQNFQFEPPDQRRAGVPLRPQERPRVELEGHVGPMLREESERRAHGGVRAEQGKVWHRGSD